MDISKARQKFATSLLGAWHSYQGGGHDMLIGMRLQFHDDGTGAMQEWGFDHQHIDPAYVSDPVFNWISVGERTFDLTHRGETHRVSYDFMSRKNEYGIIELRVFEIGREADQYGDIGFWLSPYSLVYQSEPGTSNIFRRLWERLTH